MGLKTEVFLTVFVCENHRPEKNPLCHNGHWARVNIRIIFTVFSFSQATHFCVTCLDNVRNLGLDCDSSQTLPFTAGLIMLVDN